MVRLATCCWSAVTIVRVKTAATNTAKTVDETRAMATVTGRYHHACTRTTSRRRVGNQRRARRRRRLRRKALRRRSSARNWSARPSRSSGNANRLSKEHARARLTTCSVRRRRSSSVIPRPSQWARNRRGRVPHIEHFRANTSPPNVAW